MAGECVSYGAFGAYSTIYPSTGTHFSVQDATHSPGRRIDSWQNFLPAAKQRITMEKDNERNRLLAARLRYRQQHGIENESHENSNLNQNENSDYDHEANAGIRGKSFIFRFTIS